MPHYIAAQYLGAFLASGAVFLVYWDALVWYEHDRGGYRVTPDTAAIFGTYPGHHLTLWGGVGDQVVGTGLLLLCICAITDRNNMKVSKQLVPFFVGLTILAIGVCFGYNSGYAINPARDFAPRLFSGEAQVRNDVIIMILIRYCLSYVGLGPGRVHLLLPLVGCPHPRHPHRGHHRSLDLLSRNWY